MVYLMSFFLSLCDYSVPYCASLDSGSLELVCSWTAPQCESPQVISLAKSKYLHICWIFFWTNFKPPLLLNR